MRNRSSISILIIFIILLTSCNSYERKFKEFNTRIENITLLSESLNNDNNDYLNSLIDSTKIIKNDYSVIKLDPEFKNKLEEKINVITSQLRRKIANNCILNRTFEMEIEGFDVLTQFLYPKIRLDFTMLKDNKSEIRLYSNNDLIDWEGYYEFAPKFKSIHEEDAYLIKFLNENEWIKTQNENEKVILNYEIYNDSTFKIKMDNYPILLKVKDFKDCECELIRTKYTKSRKMKQYTQTYNDLKIKSEKYNQSSDGDKRTVIEY